MSERGQGQGGQGQDPNQGKGQQQTYVVKANFTDEKGRTWTAGTAFQGDEGAVRKALAAGQIEARPKPEPTDQDQEPEKGSFSSGEA